MREKITNITTITNVHFEENRTNSFVRKKFATYSFRVQSEGFLGVHYQLGEIPEEQGWAIAERNLELKRPYKFDLETGVRHRDLTERVLSDKELLELTQEVLSYINGKYPDFTLNGYFEQTQCEVRQQNDNGLDYSNKDCTADGYINFKHKESKELTDGGFGIGLRNFIKEKQKLLDMADNYLSCFTTPAKLPDEIIVQIRYYNLLGMLQNSLDAEKMCLGTSLLSGKIGEKVFADNFTLIHDATDKESWHTNFFDGEGVTLPGDTLTYIKNGVVLRGYSDKRIADKYGVENTGSAWRCYSDTPTHGNVNFRIVRSDKTVKQLLNGRLSVVPVRYSGGGFNDKGEYVMPVQMAYLCDGERFLGVLPEFTLVSSMFDMFGRDFIGVGSDNPVFNDKQILVKMRLGKS